MLVTHEIDPRILTRDIGELVEVPIVVRITKFKEDAAKEFAAEMSEAMSNSQAVIPVVVDSYGGHVYAMFQMIDIINRSAKPVMTIVEGKAMSSGAIFASAGTKGYRYIAENATLMVHDVSSGHDGKIEEIKADAKETERLQALVFAMLDRNAGKAPGFFEQEVQKRGRADWYLTPKQAVAVGLVDHVGLPTYRTIVTVRQEII